MANLTLESVLDDLITKHLPVAAYRDVGGGEAAATWAARVGTSAEGVSLLTQAIARATAVDRDGAAAFLKQAVQRRLVLGAA